jgi:hypothetical protein
VKKQQRNVILGVVLIALAWLLVREVAARRNADSYLTSREIPVYHTLSFHGSDDRNLLGYCKPCGAKARSVLSDSVGREFDDTKRDLEKALGGK